MKAAHYRRANSYSKSFNAQMAEQGGRYPATRFKQEYGIDPRTVTTSSEWHHVGKFANRVDYYNIIDVMQALAGMPYHERKQLIKRNFKPYWDANKKHYLLEKLGNRNIKQFDDTKPFQLYTYSWGMMGIALRDTAQWGRAFRKALATGRYRLKCDVKLVATGDPNYFQIVKK